MADGWSNLVSLLRPYLGSLELIYHPRDGEGLIVRFRDGSQLRLAWGRTGWEIAGLEPRGER